jgi:NADP-dependent 3-hydroxy acid dehydrogenase YdfG
MPTIAIVGAGSGLGASIARLFGSHGFDIALIARSTDRLTSLVQQLTYEGLNARGFSADVTERPSLTTALHEAEEELGGIDVLEYSPAPKAAVAGQLPDLELAGPLDVTVENLQPEIDYHLYGSVTAARAVLPGMIERDRGTLLFTTGGGSINPSPLLGNVNAAQAAMRNWAINLHQVLDGTGVYAAHVGISAWIGGGKPDAEPDVIAENYWDLHVTRSDAERHHFAL